MIKSYNMPFRTDFDLELPYICSDCTKSYAHLSGLAKHWRVEHFIKIQQAERYSK